jgi:hypothetical protein
MNRPRQSRPSTENEPSPTFEEDYLDIDHWPLGWGAEARTLPTAQRILNLFKAFLCDLLNKRLARKTLLKHREHLCILGETIVQRINQKPDLRRKNMVPVMMVFIDEDGGPLLYPSQSLAQRSHDATCLKLRGFLLDSKPTSS